MDDGYQDGRATTPWSSLNGRLRVSKAACSKAAYPDDRAGARTNAGERSGASRARKRRWSDADLDDDVNEPGMQHSVKVKELAERLEQIRQAKQTER